MADYDSFDYEINKKMPEWYKHSGILQPINKYTQELIAELLNGLLSSTGVVQPLNCWLTIPEEYDWFHHYKDLDEYLYVINNENKYHANCIITTDNPIYAVLPNTKRKCDAKIRLRLLGNADDIPHYDEENDKIIYEKTDLKKIDENFIDLFLINGTQEIHFKKISKSSTIEINTKTNEILIDGKRNDNLIEGFFNKIEPEIKNKDYLQDDVDEPIDLEDENKETKIQLKATGNVDFDLQIKLYKPTYVTEQNIRIATVSAFPIKSVQLWGYFCHPFNNKSGYKCIWEKEYSLESRTVYDKITKKYDCERFYVKVFFHGIATPLVKGFPQEELSSDIAFQPNPMLDKWGKIYGLPRRYYKDNITEDEEPYTFPKYYKFPIEQDYWYEERIINEYRLDDEAINSLFVKDTNLDNIILLSCIYPYMHDIWVYTETLNPSSGITLFTENIKPNEITQDLESTGKEWDNPQLIISNQVSKPMYINPKSNDILKLNDYSYQTKKLLISFNLAPYKDQIPNDINIKGIELKFDADTNINTNLLRLTEDSCMKLPFFLANSNKDVIIENIDISGDMPIWNKEKFYTIGSSDYLFGEKEISKEQLFDGNNGKLEFEVSFINENDFVEAYLLINSIYLKIYYEEIQDEFDINMILDKNSLVLEDNENTINLSFFVKNSVNKKIEGKQLTVIASPEFSFQDNNNGFLFYLDKGEEFTAEMQLTFNSNRTGKYDILAFCDDKVMKQEVVVRRKRRYEVS